MARKKQMCMFNIMIGKRSICKIAATSAIEALKNYGEIYGAIVQDSEILLARSVLPNGNPIQAVRVV